MEKKLNDLLELESFIEELKAEAEGLKDEIKAEMTAQKTEELIVGSHIVRWTSCLSSRFDTKRFKEEFGESVYKKYTKEISSRRWSVA